MNNLLDESKAVESLYRLQTNSWKLIRIVERSENNVNYIIQADNRNKSPRYFVIPNEIVYAITEISNEIMERVWMDAKYGQDQLLSPYSTFETAMVIQQRAFMLLLESNILNYLNQISKKYEIRLTETIDAYHGFHNGMILFLDKHAPLQQLVDIYNNHETSLVQTTIFDNNDHEDRVDCLFALPLSLLVTLSVAAVYDYILEHILPPLDVYQHNACKKVELHHHIKEIVYPGVNSLWIGAKDLGDTKYNINNLAHAASDVSVLFTINVKKKKIVIDLPGGKRNLGETSWECAMRETREEIGFQLHNNVHIDDSRNIVNTNKEYKDVEMEKDWEMIQHYTCSSMSVFLLFGKLLVQELRQSV